jgi:hypothetical protein
MNILWDFLIRWRTWLVNLFGSILLALPDLLYLLQSTELMAVLPVGYQKWLALGLLVLNVWMRPRPASRPSDPEVQVANALKTTEPGATVTVESQGGDVKAVIDA